MGLCCLQLKKEKEENWTDTEKWKEYWFRQPGPAHSYTCFLGIENHQNKMSYLLFVRTHWMGLSKVI